MKVYKVVYTNDKCTKTRHIVAATLGTACKRAEESLWVRGTYRVSQIVELMEVTVYDN